MKKLLIIDKNDELTNKLKGKGINACYSDGKSLCNEECSVLINADNMPDYICSYINFGIILFSGNTEKLCEYQLKNANTVLCSVDSIVDYCNEGQYNKMNDYMFKQAYHYAEFYLQYLSINKNHDGFKCLAYLSSSMALSGTKLYSKDEYAEFISAFGGTKETLERNMRYAVETAWISGDMAAQLEMFGESLNPQKGKPVVRELCAMVAERIKNELFGNSQSIELPA